jgi:hypothetical protein
VAPSAHRYQQLVVASEVHGVHDVGSPRAASDEPGGSVDHAVPDPAGGIIAIIAGSQQLAAQALLESLDLRLFEHCAGCIGHSSICHRYNLQSLRNVEPRQ